MSPYFPLILLAFGALAALAIWLHFRNERRRTEGIREVALALGLKPLEPGAAPPEAASGFPLMTVGRRRRATNLHTGTVDGTPLTLFDYSYITRAGKHSHTHRFTVVFFPQAGRGVAEFDLGPEHLMDKLGQLFGSTDIDFVEDAEFSKRYRLRGTDEGAIRAAVNYNVRALLLASPRLRVESRGGALLITRTDGRFPIDELRARIDEAQRVARALARRS